jgi:hypothetical protein
MKKVNAVAVKYGIAGILNKNTYDKPDFHPHDYSEEEQTLIIKQMARIPKMVLILDARERRDYGKAITAFEVAVKENHGNFSLVKDLNEAYRAVGL